MRVDPKNGKWGLGQPTICDALSSDDTSVDAPPIVHLTWGGSAMASELAVIDATGRVAMMQFTGLLNHGVLIRKWNTHSGARSVDNELPSSSIVGCIWLPGRNVTNRPFNLVYGPAVRLPSELTVFQHQTTAVPVGVTFPIPNRTSFVTVSSNGLVQLMWNQGRNMQPESVSVELEGVYGGGSDVVTHASITSERRM